MSKIERPDLIKEERIFLLKAHGIYKPNFVRFQIGKLVSEQLAQADSKPVISTEDIGSF